MVGNLIVFFWGLAEATLFFIVPDVGLSIIASKNKRKGMVACLYALAGALIGGTIMFYWGKADIDTANRILDTIPAIRLTDIGQVKSDLLNLGMRAVLFGPLLGIPYKIYATNAHLSISISDLLLISIPARIVRFLLVTLFTSYGTDRFLPNASNKRKYQAVLLFWIVFYTIFFIVRRG
jgi:membrane protein YqaA with SNARE-associated domain